jgi:Glycine zipper
MSRFFLVASTLLAVAACGRGERKDVGMAGTSQQIAAPDSAAMNQLPPTPVDTAATQPSPPSPNPKTPTKPTPKPAAKPALPEVPAGAPSPDQLNATMSKLALFVYPAKGQSKELETREEQICYVWATNQTGIDPTKISVNADSAAQAGKDAAASDAGAAGLRGAGRGAAGGAVIGAIAGDAGTGAAIGAVAGGARGRQAKKQAEKQGAQQGAQQASAQAAQQTDTFKKGMSSCLEGKGYTVK